MAYESSTDVTTRAVVSAVAVFAALVLLVVPGSAVRVRPFVTLPVVVAEAEQGTAEWRRRGASFALTDGTWRARCSSAGR